MATIPEGRQRKRGSGGKVVALASAALLGLGSSALAGSFGYRSGITIDRTKVGNSGAPATLSNFPVLFNTTNTIFKTTANGGRVESSSGYDIIFRGTDTTTCAGTAPCGLSHELERYVATTGEVVAWVRIPSINTQTASSNTVVYVYYGASTVTSSSARATNVWDSNFQGVYHLPDGSTLAANDSTSNARNLTINSATATTGQIAGGASFNGTSAYLNESAISITAGSSITASYWGKVNTADVQDSGSFDVGDSDAPNRIMCHSPYSDSVIYWDYGDYAGGGRVSTSYTSYLNSWSLVDLVFNSGNNLHALYLNGVLKASATNSNKPTSTQTGLRVGRSFTAINYWFKGSMDEFRLSTSARSADWIKTEYNSQNSPSTFYSLDTTGQTNPVSAAGFERADVLRFADGRVFIGWRTGLEVGNLGFHVWREQGGGRQRITPALIAGTLLSGAGRRPGGSSYNYGVWDPGTPPSSDVSYFVEDVDSSGKRSMHGPFVPKEAQSPSGPDGYQRSAFLSELGATSPERRQGVTQGPLLRPERTSASRVAPRVGQALTSQPATASAWAGSQSPAVKIQVREEGLYRIDQPSLVAAGLDPQVDPRRLALFVDGREQSLRVTGEDNGVFGAGDSIAFYGQGRDQPYTDTSVYWLAAGAQKGARIPAALAAPAPATPTGNAPGSFPYVVTRRDRSTYFAPLLNGKASNFFGPVIADKPVEQALEVHHRAPGPGADDRLSVTVQGVTEGAHRVTIELNGVPAGVITLEGRDRAALETSARGLVEGANVVRLTRAEGEMDVTLVDSVSLSYAHALAADGDRLILAGAGGSTLTVTGFGTGAIQALDVTNLEAPQPLGVSVAVDGNGFAATVRAPAGETRRIFVSAESVLPRPVALEAHAPASWDSAGGADLVIIAPAALAPSLEPLKALREQQGLVVALVDVQAVYDGFSYGHEDPAGIRSFLAWTQDAWQRRPRFALLAGDGTFDPRNFLGKNAPDLVPAALVDTARLETASDDWFVDFDEDERPDMAIGRLPARAADEAALMVAKIVHWDEAPGDWKQDLLAVAGWDDVVDFAQHTRWAMADLAPRVRRKELYFDAAAPGAHDRFATELGAGAMVVNYFGHGSTEVWSGILDSQQARQLDNGPRLPIFMLVTCLNGFFQDVYTESLGEALLRAPQGGGVAAFASSGLTYPDDQLELARRVLGSLFSGQSRTLGEAVLAAKLGTSDSDVRRTWLVLGDPSMPFDAGASSGAGDRTGAGCRCQTGARPAARIGAWPLLPPLLLGTGLWTRRRSPRWRRR